MFKRLPDCLNLLFFSPQNCCEIPSERIQFRRKQIGEREKFNEKQRLEMEEFQMEAQIRQVASSHSESSLPYDGQAAANNFLRFLFSPPRKKRI